MSLVTKGPSPCRVGQSVPNSVPKLDAVSAERYWTATDRLTVSAMKLLTFLRL
jgi:hypothetical protein